MEGEGSRYFVSLFLVDIAARFCGEGFRKTAIQASCQLRTHHTMMAVFNCS